MELEATKEKARKEMNQKDKVESKDVIYFSVQLELGLLTHDMTNEDV